MKSLSLSFLFFAVALARGNEPAVDGPRSIETHAHAGPEAPGQTLALDGTAPGKVFEGVGAVSGGGGTSVLLKDYPEPQRSQILDILFKPKFAASMQTLYVEVGGDGNSTQGTEPTHMRSRDDRNYRRGYEWWLMGEAKRRNPNLTLDACAWGCPGWVGHGRFWSQDMCDYYADWILGLKSVYGLDLDAVGCRNERGPNPAWVVKFRKTLDRAGLGRVRIHGFDDPGDGRMWGWIPELEKDPAFASSLSVVGNHCLTYAPEPASVRETIEKSGKPVWDTEEHVYDEGSRHFRDAFDCALEAVRRFNLNFIERGATKVVNWYLAGSTYPLEPYSKQPPALFANSPWSGHYEIKPIIWSYAHYGQFTEIGWRYLEGGCAKLAGGGSIVSLRSAGGDFSVIAETAGARDPQRVRFLVRGSLSGRRLCVWKTTRAAQFVRQPDLARAPDGSFEMTFEPGALYSLSTTRGQCKGGFADVPPERPFPFPYRDTFEHYGDGGRFGYLPHYTADICGVFEIAGRPDGRGECLRQVVGDKAQSWAPEWKPYTVIGDERWKDYEVSASIAFDDGGWAGVMGRISETGDGWEGDPDGYYARLDADGRCALYLASAALGGTRDRRLAGGVIEGWRPSGWHRLLLRIEGSRLSVFVDGRKVLRARDSTFGRGMAGLITGGDGSVRNTACFADLVINRPGGGAVAPTRFPQDRDPIYRDSPGPGGSAPRQAGESPSQVSPERARANFARPIVLGPDDVRAFPEAPAGFDVRRDNVKRGRIELLTYSSSVTGTRRNANVYLPPGYSPVRKYPVLYLLHGIAGNEYEWIGYVRAADILDNLYAEGLAVPMIVVFPNGRALPDDRPPKQIYTQQNAAGFAKFGRDLFDCLIPAVEAKYPTIADCGHRALAGLSMGGGQALNFGLSHLDSFAWIGAFSPAPNTRSPAELLPDPAAACRRLRLLYLSSGDKDGLINVAQGVHRFLERAGVPHIWNVDDHGHDRDTWAPNLYYFVQRLFRPSRPTSAPRMPCDAMRIDHGPPT